jgi:hypothetical protein
LLFLQQKSQISGHLQDLALYFAPKDPRNWLSQYIYQQTNRYGWPYVTINLTNFTITS